MIKFSHSGIAVCFLGDLAEELIYIFSLGFLKEHRTGRNHLWLKQRKIKIIIGYSNVYTFFLMLLGLSDSVT